MSLKGCPMTIADKPIYPLTRELALEFWRTNNVCKLYKICKPNKFILVSVISDIFIFTGQLFGYEKS